MTSTGLGSQTSVGMRLRSAQSKVFWLLWSTYASYYLCRLNFAVAQPAILKEFPAWSAAQIGSIPSTYAVFGALGEIVNVTLARRFGTRQVMTLAMVLVSLTNIAFSFVSSLDAMRLLWAINGFAQSAGWSLIVQVLSDWNRSSRRGFLIGRLATCYAAGNVFSWLLASYLCDSIGWRAAFWVPGLWLIIMAAIFFKGLRDTPEQAGFPPVRDDMEKPVAQNAEPAALNSGWKFTLHILRLTLANRALWILTAGYFMMNTVRYGFINWTVQYITEFHGRSIKNSALIAILVPITGSLGTVSAGWASDHLFNRRRAPVCVVMLLGVSAVCAGMTFIPKGDWQMAAVMLGLAGFMSYGPDVLISGIATVDVSHPKAAAIATGQTMCFGALGAIFSGAGIGWVKDRAHGDWAAVFWVLAAIPLLPSLLMTFLWNVRPRDAK